MAKARRKSSNKRSRAYKGNKSNQKSNTNSIMVIGVGVLVVGLLAFGMLQVLDVGNHNQTASASTLSTGDGLEVTSIEDGHTQDAVAPAEVTDRETRYLGPASDPATVALAEAGELGQPTLVWFHADWCHICQRVKPEVIDLGEAYDGRVKIVRLNVDHGESRDALRRYGVRATPTFVLFDAEGQLRGNVPGWPGLQAFTGAFDTLLTDG